MQQEVEERIKKILSNVSGDKELMLYFWGDEWSIHIGNESCVMLGEVEGTYNARAKTLNSVLSKAELHFHVKK